MEVGFVPLKDSKLSTREFVALHLINRSSRLLSYPNYTNAQLLLLNIWKIQVNIVVNVYWMDQWCLSLSILNNCNFFSVLKNTNFDEAFARAKDRSNYLELNRMSIWCVKTWRKFIRFAFRVFCFPPVFDMTAFQPSFGTRAQNSVLDCECLKSLQIYFDYFFFKNDCECSKLLQIYLDNFLKIISNKVAPSLTVTSGFEMLFAKIPSNIFRFTIYIIDWKLIKKIYWK